MDLYHLNCKRSRKERRNDNSLGCCSPKRGVGSSRGCLLSGTPKQVAATSFLGLDVTREPAQQLGRRRPGKWNVQLSYPGPHTCWDAAVGIGEEGKLLEGGPQAFLSPHRRP